MAHPLVRISFSPDCPIIPPLTSSPHDQTCSSALASTVVAQLQLAYPLQEPHVLRMCLLANFGPTASNHVPSKLSVWDGKYRTIDCGFDVARIGQSGERDVPSFRRIKNLVPQLNLTTRKLRSLKWDKKCHLILIHIFTFIAVLR